MADETKTEGKTPDNGTAGTIAGMSRRSFALGCGGAVALLALGGLKVAPAEAHVRPPGGQDEEHLIGSCIRCERCVEACPNGALRPAHLEDGVLAVRTPTSNFDKGWCDFCESANEGNPLCAKACPTQALRLEAGASALTTVLGTAYLIQDWCLAYRNTGCRFCFDACAEAGYDAIELDRYNHPTVIEDKCVGCGACQSVCVSQKEGSIREGTTSRAIIVVSHDELVRRKAQG